LAIAVNWSDRAGDSPLISNTLQSMHLSCGNSFPMTISPLWQRTLTEFLQLPETQPAGEFSAGEIIQKPMPQGKHCCDWLSGRSATED
jgi:hypothetical protein